MYPSLRGRCAHFQTRKRTMIGLTVFGTLLFGGAGQDQAVGQEYVPGHVLVRFKASATASARDDIHAAAGAVQILRTYHLVSEQQRA